MHDDPPNRSRRSFLRRSLALGGGFAAWSLSNAKGSSPAENGSSGEPALTPDHRLVRSSSGEPWQKKAVWDPEKVRLGDPRRKWVMVIDLAKCDGCKSCTAACGKMHHVPKPREWIPVFVMREAPEEAPYFFPKPCFHCDKPPCTKVCPVNATFKRLDGLVLIDNTRCIGCRFCMAACPYSTRVFNWGDPPAEELKEGRPYSPEWGYPRRRGTVEKCDFCPDMAAQGRLPACADGCPMGAIYYGDENEDAVTNGVGQTVSLSKLLRDRAGYRYLEELGTEPRVFYLPPKDRRYPAPDERPAQQGAGSGNGGQGR